MSPRPAAPSSASIRACASTSASECPARPRSDSGISTPPTTRRRPSSRRCESQPMPARALNRGSSQLLHAASAAIEHRDLLDPDLAEPFHCALILPAELLGSVGVARKRHGPPNLEAQLEEAAGRVDLTHGLA